MSFPISLPQNGAIVELLDPATDAAGRTSPYVSLKLFHKAWIIFHVQQGNAATIALTVNQAKDVSGTSAKAITVNTPIWANQDTSASDALTAQTAGVSFTTSATLKNKIVVFEINPSDLDVANGFRSIALTTGASNAANVTQAMLYGVFDRYQQATPPSATVN